MAKNRWFSGFDEVVWHLESVTLEGCSSRDTPSIDLRHRCERLWAGERERSVPVIDGNWNGYDGDPEFQI